MTTAENATRDLPAPAGAAVEAAGRVTAAGFWLASRLRGTKVFHPRGVVHEATVMMAGRGGAATGVGLFDQPGTYEALIRFSRGAGLPRSLPDVLGMAIRLLDAHGRGRHQDFLLVTSGDGPLVQHLLLPARSFESLPYSSVLPYSGGGRTWLVGARRRRGAPSSRNGDEFADLLELSSSGGPAFELCIARLGRRLRPVGDITLGRRLEASANAIRFDPFNSGGGLQPVTILNRLRAYAYPASQRGWQGAPPATLSAGSEQPRQVA